MKACNAYQLKLAMAGLMVLDHLDIIPGFIPDQLGMVFHMMTRCVAVFFAYMLVEGYLHTRNVKTIFATIWCSRADGHWKCFDKQSLPIKRYLHR